MGTSANGIWIVVIVAVFGLVVWLTSMAAAARGQARDGRGEADSDDVLEPGPESGYSRRSRR
jgi:hypothetical protein